MYKQHRPENQLEADDFRYLANRGLLLGYYLLDDDRGGEAGAPDGRTASLSAGWDRSGRSPGAL